MANTDPSRAKHEIVKLLLVMKLLEKYQPFKNKLRIYTEFELENGLKCDIYFENAKTKEVRVYDIQGSCTKAWLEERKTKYKEGFVPFMSADWVLVDLSGLSDNIEELKKQLDKYIL